MSSDGLYADMELLDAAEHNDLEGLLVALADGADPNVRMGEEHSDFTPLIWMCCHGNLDAIQALLAAGADPVGNYPHYTSLMATAIDGSIECMEVLLAAGVDVQQKDPLGKSALDYALADDRYDAAWLLAELGCTTTAFAWFGAFFAACKAQDDPEILKLSRDARIPEALLLRALPRVEDCPAKYLQQYAALGSPFDERVMARRMRDHVTAPSPVTVGRALRSRENL